MLGLAWGASRELIKTAHRRLVKQHHPDMGGEPEASRTVDAAYQLLMRQEWGLRQDGRIPVVNVAVKEVVIATLHCCIRQVKQLLLTAPACSEDGRLAS